MSLRKFNPEDSSAPEVNQGSMESPEEKKAKDELRGNELGEQSRLFGVEGKETGILASDSRELSSEEKRERDLTAKSRMIDGNEPSEDPEKVEKSKNKERLSEAEREKLFHDFPSEHCEKSVGIVKNATVDGKAGGEHDDKGENFTNHTQEHLEQVLEKSNETVDALIQAIDHDMLSVENPTGDVAFCSDVDRRVVDCTALMHDMGMSNDGYVKEEDGSFSKQNGLNFDDVRNNHSLNSAMRVLENRDVLMDKYGLSEEQVDRAALECYAHSKSKSGMMDLNSSEDWKTGVAALNKLTETYNADHKDDGMQISFHGEEFLQDKETLGQMATETLALRSGDVSRNSGADATCQSGEVVHVDKNAGYYRTARSWEDEAKSISASRNGTEITNEKAKQVHAGEQNIANNRNYFDKDRGFVHEITVADGNFAPCCTFEAMKDHFGEFGSAKSCRFEIDIVFDNEPSNEVIEKYKSLLDKYMNAEKVEKRCPENIEINLSWEGK